MALPTRTESDSTSQHIALSAAFVFLDFKPVMSHICLAPYALSFPHAQSYQIISSGAGYVVDGGDVFFSVSSSPGYGQLSGRQQQDNRAGERVAVDARKRDPADFALWKVREGGREGGRERSAMLCLSPQSGRVDDHSRAAHYPAGG